MGRHKGFTPYNRYNPEKEKLVCDELLAGKSFRTIERETGNCNRLSVMKKFKTIPTTYIATAYSYATDKPLYLVRVVLHG